MSDAEMTMSTAKFTYASKIVLIVLLIAGETEEVFCLAYIILRIYAPLHK